MWPKKERRSGREKRVAKKGEVAEEGGGEGGHARAAASGVQWLAQVTSCFAQMTARSDLGESQPNLGKNSSIKATRTQKCGLGDRQTDRQIGK